jgi:cell division protein ZapA (FtsZ GTPase activity inhibitor)
MSQAATRCDEMASLFQSQTHKLEQNFKSMLEKQAGLRDTEERLNYEMEELDRKINKIETTMLQQIRDGCRKD